MIIMRPQMTKNKLTIYIVQMAPRFSFFMSFFDGTEEKMQTLFHLLSLKPEFQFLCGVFASSCQVDH